MEFTNRKTIREKSVTEVNEREEEAREEEVQEEEAQGEIRTCIYQACQKEANHHGSLTAASGPLALTRRDAKRRERGDPAEQSRRRRRRPPHTDDELQLERDRQHAAELLSLSLRQTRSSWPERTNHENLISLTKCSLETDYWFFKLTLCNNRSWDEFHDCANVAMAGCPEEAAAVWESLRQESKKMQFSGNLYDMCSNRNSRPAASASPHGSPSQEEINQESLRGRAGHLACRLHLLMSPLLLLLFWI
ncbi:Neuritin-like protein [Nibea albiflora]|uniref:Neuritin-like protein n=1 Tax=Nibea albiflora TaxID=240163 RepID=A0ACB7FFA1_NIBAL|nr:Neuritin-like protein [Nibea albiflora]